MSKYENGDCYKASFDFVMDNPDWVLVHGIAVITNGPHKGKEFGHAWAERGEIVHDGASGKEVPKVLFYAIGNINYTKEYTYNQARQKAVKTGIYGCWDKKIAKALHS